MPYVMPPRFKVRVGITYGIEFGLAYEVSKDGKVVRTQILPFASFQSEARHQVAVTALATALSLPPAHQRLRRIETYDISNLQGQLATGSMIVFTKGVPDKSQYRKFRLRRLPAGGQTTNAPNDTAMLQEIIRRRFAPTHLDWPRPDLLLIDGGKGQRNAVSRVLDELGLDIPVAAIAKPNLAALEDADKIYLRGAAEPVRLPYDSPALFLLQQMRDEAHRFTIGYHRLLRSNRQTKSILDDVPGIGPVTRKKLLRNFGSLKRLRAASDKEIVAVIGEARTQSLRNNL